jgi:hypothetical protein
MDPTSQLIIEIDAFLERSRMSATAFGLKAFNDPRFVHGLRDGREPRWRTLERARDFIRQQDAASQKESAA